MIQWINHLNLEQEIGFKKIINQQKDMIIVTLDLKNLL